VTLNTKSMGSGTQIGETELNALAMFDRSYDTRGSSPQPNEQYVYVAIANLASPYRMIFSWLHLFRIRISSFSRNPHSSSVSTDAGP
jgi:hypothetical protein